MQVREDTVDIGPLRPVEIACAAVAGAAFGHVSEFRQRKAFEEALLELVRAIADDVYSRVDGFAARIAGLEKDTHPPVPLRPLIIEEVHAAMKLRECLVGERR